jgi:hypothetical protein
MSLDKRIQRAHKTHGKGLDPSENILWADSAFLVLTDARLVSFSPISSRAWTSTVPIASFSARISDIDLDFTPVSKGTKLQIRLKTGRIEDLAMGRLTPSETQELMDQLRAVSLKPKLIDTIQPITSENRAQINAEAKAEKRKIKEEEKAEFEAKYGQVVVSEPFATKWITIYSKGYVKVSAGMGIIKGDVEKLLDIFGETDITRKTGLGRAVGAVFTMGANIALSPSQRGNVYLTIATERETYSIAWERPDQGSLRTMNRLVSAGKAALSRSAMENRGAPAPALTQKDDLATQLANLAKLRDNGALSEVEFEKAKAKLLG